MAAKTQKSLANRAARSAHVMEFWKEQLILAVREQKILQDGTAKAVIVDAQLDFV